MSKYTGNQNDQLRKEQQPPSFKYVDLNFILLSSNAQHERRLLEVHQQLFEKQNEQIIVGPVYRFSSSDFTVQKEQLLQVTKPMFWKRQAYFHIQQILVILTHQEEDIQKTMTHLPFTTYVESTNQYYNDPIIFEETNGSKFYLKQQLKEVRDTIQREQDMVIFDYQEKKPNDWNLNRILFLGHLEELTKDIHCFVIQINCVNQLVMDHKKIANRIFTVFEKMTQISKQK